MREGRRLITSGAYITKMKMNGTMTKSSAL